MKFIEILLILFIALKLTGFITWSWWLVLGPLWVGPLFIIVIPIIAKVAGKFEK